MSDSYIYRAYDQTGNDITGTIEGDNEKDIARMLKDKGYFIISIRAQKSRENRFSTLHRKFLSSLKTEEMAYFCRQFSMLINAGIPLLSSLELLIEEINNPRLEEVLIQVSEDVEKGENLYKAFSSQDIFTDFFLELIRIGEVGGLLGDVLHRLADHYQKELKLKNSIKSAVSYPLVVVGISLGVLILLMVGVLPVFVDLYSGLGIVLPLPTRIILGVSYFAAGWWPVLLSAFLVLILLIFSYLKRPSGRLKYHAFILKLPLVGKVFQKGIMSHFAYTIAVLNASGITLLNSLNIVEKVIANRVVAKEVSSAAKALEEGMELSQFLRQSQIFPSFVRRMVSTGEKTGSIEKVMSRIAEYYEEEIEKEMESLINLIEPCLIVFLALVIGFVVISVVLPLFELMSIL